MFLSLASLMTEETIADLDDRIGPAFRTLPEAARLVLASTLDQGVTTHDYLKAVTGLHPSDLTHLLRDLKFQGLLVPEGKGRGMHYRLANPQHLTGNPQHLQPNPQLLPESPQHPAGLQGDREEGPISWEALERVAGAARTSGKLPRTQVENLILDLCREQFLSLQDLGRLPDVPCPPEGMFQNQHDLASMGHLAEHLKAQARMHYGHAARSFLRGISEEWERHEAMVSRLREMESAWIAAAVPPSADGQVRRVAARFALVAVAGELAQRMGVLPWPPGEASQGVLICYQAWVDHRGHIGASERERGLQGVVDFLALHGLSRFAEWNNPEAKPVNMAGVRKAAECGGVKMEDGWDFFLSPTGWKEACRGFDSRGVARDAIEEGILEASQDGAPYQKRKTPHGQGRYYVIRGRNLGAFRSGGLP